MSSLSVTTPCYSLGCAAGDNIVASDGDFTEDGQSVVGQKVQLGVPQLRMWHEPGKESEKFKYDEIRK